MGNIKFFLFFLAIGLILYFPIFYSGFAGDDYYQLVKNSDLHKVEAMFKAYDEVIGIKGVDVNGLTGFFYRPLTFSIYVVLYGLSGGDPLVFHVFQFGVYMIGVFLVFLLFKCFFSIRLAFMMTGVFLVHPVNSELGAYIAALFDTLCLVFGVAAIVFLVRVKRPTYKRLIFVSLFLSLSLFSKEAGVLFVILSIVYMGLRGWGWRCFMGPIISLLVYLIFRANASGNIMFETLSREVKPGGIIEHFYLVIQAIYQLLKEIVMPSRDALSPEVYRLDFLSSLLPFFIIGVCASGVVGLFFIVKKYARNKIRDYLFFLSFVFLGIVFYSQIIPLETNFAPRWLYVALIGALGMGGVVVSSLPDKVKRNRYFRLGCIFLGIGVLLYAVQTLVISYLWVDWE